MTNRPAAYLAITRDLWIIVVVGQGEFGCRNHPETHPNGQVVRLHRRQIR
jgi:hypothetical protein